MSFGRVGVAGRQRAVVAGRHRLEHVQRLARTTLADDDPVGSHVHRVPEQVPDRDLALALQVGRARLQGDDVVLAELELGGVLDRDDPLVVDGMNDERTLRVVVLPEPVPPDTNRLSRASMQARRNSNISGVAVPKLMRSSTVYGVWENLRTVMTGPMSDSGSMIALTREPSGRRASTRGLDSSIRRPSGVMIRSMTRRTCWSLRKTQSTRSILPRALDVDVVRPVDHDLGDGRVGEQRLQRAEAGHVVDHLVDEARPLRRA